MKLVTAASGHLKLSYLGAIESCLNHQNNGKTELYEINCGA